MVEKIAVLYPGQGSQDPRMFENIPEDVKDEVFSAAKEELGTDIISVLTSNSEEELKKNNQIAVLASNVMHWKLLERLGISPYAVAGHSAGTYAGLVANTALALRNAFLLSYTRQNAMRKCIPSEMLVPETSHMAIAYTDDLDIVSKACEKTNKESGAVGVANINLGHIIISGNNAAVIETIKYLQSQDINTGYLLKVEGPWHSELMRPAAGELEKALANIPIGNFSCPYVDNVTGKFVYDSDQVKDSLVKQIYSPVQFKASIDLLIENGVTKFIECGYGTVLKKMLFRYLKNEQFKDRKIEVVSSSDLLKIK